MPNPENEGWSGTAARRGVLLSRAAVTGALALLVGACSWYPAERGQRLEGRVDRIEEGGPSASGAAPNAASREQVARVDAAVGDLRKRLDALEAAPRAKAGPPEGQQELAGEVARLRASLDQQTKRIDEMERTLARAREPAAGGEKVAAAPPQRRAPEKAVRRAPPQPAPSAPPAEPPPSLSGTGAGQEGSGALALAREQERRGQKGVARELYQQYVTQFPTDPASAEAHYRLGDRAYGDRRYKDAISEFGKVAENFPRSEQAPEALVRTADSMIALGMRDDAALLLAEVPKRYPGTPAAARAKQRLAQLPKSAPAGKTNE